MFIGSPVCLSQSPDRRCVFCGFALFQLVVSLIYAVAKHRYFFIKFKTILRAMAAQVVRSCCDLYHVRRDLVRLQAMFAVLRSPHAAEQYPIFGSLPCKSSRASGSSGSSLMREAPVILLSNLRYRVTTPLPGSDSPSAIPIRKPQLRRGHTVGRTNHARHPNSLHFASRPSTDGRAAYGYSLSGRTRSQAPSAPTESESPIPPATLSDSESDLSIDGGASPEACLADHLTAESPPSQLLRGASFNAYPGITSSGSDTGPPSRESAASVPPSESLARTRQTVKTIWNKFAHWYAEMAARPIGKHVLPLGSDASDSDESRRVAVHSDGSLGILVVPEMVERVSSTPPRGDGSPRGRRLGAGRCSPLRDSPGKAGTDSANTKAKSRANSKLRSLSYNERAVTRRLMVACEVAFAQLVQPHCRFTDGGPTCAGDATFSTVDQSNICRRIQSCSPSVNLESCCASWLTAVWFANSMVIPGTEASTDSAAAFDATVPREEGYLATNGCAGSSTTTAEAVDLSSRTGSERMERLRQHLDQLNLPDGDAAPSLPRAASGTLADFEISLPPQDAAAPPLSSRRRAGSALCSPTLPCTPNTGTTRSTLLRAHSLLSQSSIISECDTVHDGSEMSPEQSPGLSQSNPPTHEDDMQRLVSDSSPILWRAAQLPSASASLGSTTTRAAESDSSSLTLPMPLRWNVPHMGSVSAAPTSPVAHSWGTSGNPMSSDGNSNGLMDDDGDLPPPPPMLARQDTSTSVADGDETRSSTQTTSMDEPPTPKSSMSRALTSTSSGGTSLQLAPPSGTMRHRLSRSILADPGGISLQTSLPPPQSRYAATPYMGSGAVDPGMAATPMSTPLAASTATLDRANASQHALAVHRSDSASSHHVMNSVDVTSGNNRQSVPMLHPRVAAAAWASRPPKQRRATLQPHERHVFQQLDAVAYYNAVLLQQLEPVVRGLRD